jgi:hypothetical protein
MACGESYRGFRNGHGLLTFGFACVLGQAAAVGLHNCVCAFELRFHVGSRHGQGGDRVVSGGMELTCRRYRSVLSRYAVGRGVQEAQVGQGREAQAGQRAER